MVAPYTTMLVVPLISVLFCVFDKANSQNVGSSASTKYLGCLCTLGANPMMHSRDQLSQSYIKTSRSNPLKCARGRIQDFN